MRILYVGPMTPGSVSLARVEALRSLGHEVCVTDHRPYFRRGTLLNKVQAHLLAGPAVSACFSEVSATAQTHRPDLIFCEGFYFSPDRIRQLRAHAPRVVGYTSDYFGYRRYFYRHLAAGASLYDAIVITNQLNLGFLKRWGARCPLMTRFGYDPGQHYPVRATGAQRSRFACDVAFGGHREPFYEDMLRALSAAGMSLRISGSGWSAAKFLRPEERVGHISPEDYRAMICCAKVAPAFLSKWNRNTSGGRLFEVAAMGGLLVAERTEEQTSCFEEGTEAEFFSSPQELVEKARKHVGDSRRREAVAAAGHRRCVASAYAYVDRMRSLIAEIEELRRS